MEVLATGIEWAGRLGLDNDRSSSELAGVGGCRPDGVVGMEVLATSAEWAGRLGLRTDESPILKLPALVIVEGPSQGYGQSLFRDLLRRAVAGPGNWAPGLCCSKFRSLQRSVIMACGEPLRRCKYVK